jgi:DNA-binding MltR family transcriptional regulator
LPLGILLAQRLPLRVSLKLRRLAPAFTIRRTRSPLASIPISEGHRPCQAARAEKTGKQEVGSMTDRTRVIIHTINLGDVIRELRTKSQAGTVLVSAAVVDDGLQQLLLTKMRTLSNNKANRIFNGPLRSFTAKIDVAYAFELIDDELYDDLTTIRDIRNEFAHSVNETHFERPEIVELVQRFKGREASSIDAFSFFQHRIDSCSNQIKGKLDRFLFDHAVKD